MNGNHYTFWSVLLAVITSGAICVAALAIMRSIRINADRVIRKLPSLKVYDGRRILDDPRFNDAQFIYFNRRQRRRQRPVYRGPVKGQRMTSFVIDEAHLGDAEYKGPQETPVSDCCFGELGTAGVFWTIDDGFFCRNCGHGCYRLLFRGDAPPKRTPQFGCLACDPVSCGTDHKCICPRLCTSQLCISLNDPMRGDEPGYEAPIGSRFA